MPSRTYSKEQKEAVRQRLLETGLALYSKQGIKGARLVDILAVVGISKPFFYTFFPSVAEFVLQVLDFQWTRYAAILVAFEADHSRPWQEQARELLDKTVHYDENGLLVMTQEEQVWVRARLDGDRYETFMTSQISFFRRLLALWNIDAERCPPKVLANMVISSVLIYNSAKQALPFLYLDELEETAHAHSEAIIAYLDTRRE